MSSKVSLAYCTFPDEATARKVCRVLVEEGLIACANIFPPMKSIYEWQGEVREENECAAILKTASLKRGRLTERFRGLHPYEVPALVYLPVDEGLPEFLRWISSQTL